MKVLMTLPAVGQVYGGPSKSTLELVQALGQQGIEIDFVTTNANGRQPLAVPLKQWLSQDHFRIQYFPSWVVKDYKWSSSLARWSLQNLKSYDLVHINAIFSLPNFPIYWCCHRQDIPYLVSPRGMLTSWALAYKAWKKQIYYSLLEYPALQKANAIHALVLEEAEQMKPLNLKAPIVTIPNGIHQNIVKQIGNPYFFLQEFPNLQGKILILFLGRIDPKKGLDLLASAFAQIHAQFPQTHLVIAGPDNIGFLPTVQTYFEQAGCAQAVTFTGMLTGDLKYSALAATSLYVAPSYSEGFSMSILEGMAAGLPCVITTGCNFPEAGQAQAAHVVEINSEAIAQALRQCLANPQAAREMGVRAKKLVLSDYTWNSIAKKMITVYEAILTQQSIPYQFK